MKKLTKNIICFFVYYSGILNLALKFLINKKTNLPIILLIYHKITEDINSEINDNLTINHPLENFSREMEFLKKWCNIVSLDEALDILKSKRASEKPTIAITFDDGFEDNYRLAFPILKKLNIPATIFLTAGLIGTDHLPWVDRIGESIFHSQQKKLCLNPFFKNTVFSLETVNDKRDSFNKITTQLKEINYSDSVKSVDEIIRQVGEPSNTGKRMLNWHEAREMSENNIAFGAHTMTHPILSKMPTDLAKRQINDSKTTIEEKAGIAVKHFAFPNGRTEDFSEELKQYCKEIGFESVSTAIYGSNPLNTDTYSLKRISPGKNMPIFAVDLIRAFLRKD